MVAETKKKVSLVLTISTLCLVGEWSSSNTMMVSACTDISTHIPCSGVRPFFIQPANNKVCYNTAVEDGPCDPESCEATEIPETNQPIEFTQHKTSTQAKIWSPGTLEGSSYLDERLCRYRAECPPGFFTYYSWIEGNFILEDEHPTAGCLDYLQIDTGTSATTLMCGYQKAFSDVTSMPIKMEFRTNTRNRYLGFQIDVLCVNPVLTITPKTSLTTSGGSLTKVGEDTNSNNLDGQIPFAIGCQELPDPREKLIEIPTFNIPQFGRRVDVPREAFVEYRHNTVTIVANREIQRTIKNINYFFFQTGYNGTQTFDGSAPAGMIYGGGVLRVFLSLAYYVTDRIPPQFEPNRLEREVIGMLLNATKPFFMDDGGTTSPPGFISPTIDPRIDLQALQLAQRFQSACNIFLREAALSYLNILEELNIIPPFYIG